MARKFKRLRPCVVCGRPHLFHRWIERRWVVEESPMVGGHPAGQCAMPLAIVEDMTGKVYEVRPTEIRFVDRIMEEYEKEGYFDGQLYCQPNQPYDPTGGLQDMS